MNKAYIEGVIVVEGKSDVSYLSSFIESNFFITNGYDLNEEKMNFLKRASAQNRIIILTDNDDAGRQIENKLKSKISGSFALKSEKITKKNSKKSGVAETDKEEILKVLSPFITLKNNDFEKPSYNLASIISLADNPAEIRKQIINYYRLIDGNNNFLEQQLRILKIDELEFKQKYGNK